MPDPTPNLTAEQQSLIEMIDWRKMRCPQCGTRCDHIRRKAFEEAAEMAEKMKVIEGTHLVILHGPGGWNDAVESVARNIRALAKEQADAG